LQASVSALQESNASLASKVVTMQSELNALKGNSVLALDGKLGLDGTTAVFSGVDVQITNGSGMTVGPTPAGNGGGNLIIGYNEPLTIAQDICSNGNLGVDPQPANSPVPAGCVAPAVWGNNQHNGTHNIVVGFGNSYTSFGGLVVGEANAISNAFAVVVGGNFSTASGAVSSVSGGSSNYASGASSSVGGGIFNKASGTGSSVSGGEHNIASGVLSTVAGGFYNTASGAASSVSGGKNVTNAIATGWSAGSLTQ
jgi:hypothetical protein